MLIDAGERPFDVLDGGRLALFLLTVTPFLRLADAEPLPRGDGIGRQIDRIGRIDRILAGMLEDLGALDGAADDAGIERTFDPGVGMLLADDHGLGEGLMGVAPAIDGADADLEMLGELFIGRAETAHGTGLIGKFGFVDHGIGITAAG